MANFIITGFLESMKFQKISFNSGIAGVEIGSDWLKIAQKERAKNEHAFYRVSLLKLAQIKDDVATAIMGSFRLLSFNKQHVVVCIPRHLVTVRMLDLPSTNVREISDMIDLQIGKQTPYAKEDIVFAHKIVEAGASGYTKVMLAIVTRNIVSERMGALAKAGLNLKRIAISSEGVCNWFRRAYLADMKLQSSQAIILLDVDSNYSDFIVMRKGKMVFTRNILIGANHLTQETAGRHEKFSEELKQSLERYRGLEKNVEIVKTYLSGSGPNIKGLDGILNAALGICVENADQLKNLHLRGMEENLRNEELKFVSITPLLGVTMDDGEPCMDLTPNEVKIQNLMERKTKQLTVMGILVVAIVTVLSFLCLTSFNTKNAYLATLKKKMSKIAMQVEGIDKMRAVIDMVEGRLDSRGSSLECLSEIYKITPKEISLTDIDIEEKQSVVLKGHGFAMSDVFKYAKMLEDSEMFENVKTPSIRVKNEKDAKYAEFEINCAYQK